MKKILLLLFLAPFFAAGQHGKVYDNLVVKSKILNMDRKFAIYLPPDYETSQRSYPVPAGFNSAKCSTLRTKPSAKAAPRP